MQSIQFPLIPIQAFLYFPRDQEIHQTRNKQSYRLIFEGGVPFKVQERAKLNELFTQIKSSSENQHLALIKESTLLRFLQSTKFDMVSCMQQLKKYKSWQNSFFPFTVKPDLEILLQKGYFYLTGRDKKFRPIIVFDVLKMLNADLNGKTFYQLIGYFFQFIVQNCLIQGQVETWVTIVDLAKLGIFSLTGDAMDSIKTISNFFKCRLHKSYTVNCPGSFTFFYGILKRLMTDDQANKIVLIEESFLPQQAFNQMFQDQIQQKYGGKRRNITQFWLPQMNNGQYSDPSQTLRLITIEQYGLKYQNGLLNHRKINKELLSQYQLLKAKDLMKKQEKALIKAKMQKFLQKQNQSLQKEQSEASDEGQPPEIHVIPHPFSMKDIFQFNTTK